MDSIEREKLIDLLLRPKLDGVSYLHVIEAVAKLHGANAIAYNGVEWNTGSLKLRQAFPPEHENNIMEADLGILKPTEKCITTACYHRARANYWDPIYLRDVRNLAEKDKDSYFSVDPEIRSEIAFPIRGSFVIDDSANYTDEPRPLIGVLVLSGRQVGQFDDSLYSGDLLKTVDLFSIAASWQILRGLEEVWSNISNRITQRASTETRIDSFFEATFDALQKYVRDAVKVASIWLCAEWGNKSVLIREHFREFRSAKPIQDFMHDPISESNNNNRAFLEVFLDAKAQTFQDDVQLWFRPYHRKRSEMVLRRYKEWTETFELTASDRVCLFPIIVNNVDDRDSTSPAPRLRVSGLVELCIAEDSFPFIFTDQHLKTMSFAVGNGLDRVIRNKRKSLTDRISKISELVIPSFDRFLHESLVEFTKLISADWIGLFIYDDSKRTLELRHEISVDEKLQLLPLEISCANHSKDPIVRILDTHENISNVAIPISDQHGFSDPHILGERFSEIYGRKCWEMLLQSVVSRDNRRVAVIAAINNTSMLTCAGYQTDPLQQQHFFTDENRLIIKQYAERLSPYFTIHAMQEQVLRTSVLQNHEIRHQAMAISNKANELRIQAIPHHLVKEKATDIENWGLNILYLTEIDRIMRADRTHMLAQNLDFKQDLLLNWKSVLTPEANRNVRYIQFPHFSPRHQSPSLRTDKSAASMVIVNLLQNAIEYSFICTPIRIFFRRHKRGVFFEVTDYGLGIPESEQQLIWQETYRSRAAKEVRDLGTGVGLHAVQHILTNLGLGEVVVKSEHLFDRNPFLLFFARRNMDPKTYTDLVARNNDLTEAEEDFIRTVLPDSRTLFPLDRAFQQALSEKFKDRSPASWNYYVERFPLYRTSFQVTFFNLP